MSDDTTAGPVGDDPTPPAAGPPPAAPPPPVAPPPPAAPAGPPPSFEPPAYAPLMHDRWRRRRMPLLIVAAALVLGCFMGVGATLIGAFVVGHHGGHHFEHGFHPGDRGGLPNRGGGFGPNTRNGGTQPSYVVPAPATT